MNKEPDCGNRASMLTEVQKKKKKRTTAEKAVFTNGGFKGLKFISMKSVQSEIGGGGCEINHYRTRIPFPSTASIQAKQIFTPSRFYSHVM